jgi:DNA (cytosine-5)-methyltransferase 1
LTHADLFCGPGGVTTGLRAAGIQTVAAVECDAAASATHRLNHPEVPMLEADVRDLTGADLLRHAPGGPCREVVAVTAGIPCQPFSFAGNKSRASFDHRQLLFREAVRLATEVRATVVLLECVPGVTTKRLHPDDPTLVIDALRRKLDLAGYRNRVEAVLDASRYGVPQKRRRWFLLGSRDNTLSLRLPEPTTARPVAVRDAFAELPAWAGGDEYIGPRSDYSGLLCNSEFWRLPTSDGRLTHHDAPGHRAATIARYSLLRPGRRVEDLFRRLGGGTVAGLRVAGVLPEAPYRQRGQRLHPDRPAPTVTGHCGEELVHWRENRGITVREAARLSSFPDGYRFGGRVVGANDAAEQSMFRQIGNAVAPLLAYQIGLTLKEVLR